MLALTGYFGWHKICVERGILPGMQELVRRIGDDERRHMAWGTFTCRRHVAADDANWDVFESRMNELMPLALDASPRRASRCTTRCRSVCRRTRSCSTPPTRGCGGSAPSAAPAGARSPRSTSTTRRCSWRTPSPTRTRRLPRRRGACRYARLRPPRRLADPHGLGVAERADARGSRVRGRSRTA